MADEEASTGPIHAQVRAELLRRVQAGEWPPGQCIPGEVDLAAELGVSVGTVRRALEDLVQSRLLERRRRRGTVVTQHTQALMRDQYFHVVRREDLHKAFPEHQVLAFRTGPPDRLVAAALGPQPVHQVESLATLHGLPVLLDRIFIPQALAPDLTQALFAGKESSAFALYQQRYQVTVHRALETVEAVQAPAAIARRLQVEPGDPLLEIRRTAFSLGGEPVEFRRRFLHTGRHVYLQEHGAGQR